MIRSVVPFSAVVVLLFATACSGGTSRAVPRNATNAGPTGAMRTADFTLKIPNATAAAANGRRAAYVSPATLSGVIAVNGGASQELDLSAGSSACTTITGGRACSIVTTAPIGNDAVAITLYDGAFSGGHHQGNALSAATNFAIAVTEGAQNVSIPLILNGIVATADVAAAGTIAARAVATVPLIVTAYDVDGNIIIGGGSYIDGAGNAGLTVASAIATSQVTLHDGAQSGSSVTVAGPTDSVTLQLSGSVDILGVPFSVTDGAGTRILKHATQIVALSGTLTQTLLAAQINYFPDYAYTSPLDATQATGLPNGFAVSIGTASSGGYLGYFDSALEAFSVCTFNTSFNLAAAAVTGGLAVTFNGAYNVDTPPFGVAYYPQSTITGGGNCGAGTRLTNANGRAQALGFDQTNATLLEGDSDLTLYADSFSGSAFSAHTLVQSYGGSPNSLYSFNGLRSYLVGGSTSTIFQQQAPSAPQSFSTTATALHSLTVGPDKRTYALDSSSKTVWVESGLTTPALFGTGVFPTAPASQTENLAIGPDGAAYTSDGASIVESLTAGGATASVTLPALPGGTGFVRSVFDGKNGYVYAYVDAGFHNGTQNVFRISY